MFPFRSHSNLDDLKAASDQLTALYAKKQEIRRKYDRIFRQIPGAQQLVSEARIKRDALKAIHADTLAGVTDFGDVSAITTARAAMDEAALICVMRQDDFRSIMDAQALTQKQLDEVNKEITQLYQVIRDLAQVAFKEKYSRDELWKSGATDEFDWRAGQLNELLARLQHETPSTMQALLVFLGGSSFRAVIRRGFRNVNARPAELKWSDAHGCMVDIVSSPDIREFRPMEEIKVPTDLQFKTAFEQLSLGRLELVS